MKLTREQIEILLTAKAIFLANYCDCDIMHNNQQQQQDTHLPYPLMCSTFVVVIAYCTVPHNGQVDLLGVLYQAQLEMARGKHTAEN